MRFVGVCSAVAVSASRVRYPICRKSQLQKSDFCTYYLRLNFPEFSVSPILSRVGDAAFARRQPPSGP